MSTPWTYGGATFSSDRVYRHHLWRAKFPDANLARRLGVCMLNPSTAGEVPVEQDDATIRKLRGFCDRWGFHRFDVVNLFDFAATKPKDLWAAKCELWSHAADEWIRDVAGSADAFLVAWGGLPTLARARSERVLGMLGESVVCIGVTKSGYPLHPVMAGYTNEPILFDGAACNGQGQR